MARLGSFSRSATTSWFQTSLENFGFIRRWFSVDQKKWVNVYRPLLQETPEPSSNDASFSQIRSCTPGFLAFAKPVEPDSFFLLPPAFLFFLFCSIYRTSSYLKNELSLFFLKKKVILRYILTVYSLRTFFIYILYKYYYRSCSHLAFGVLNSGSFRAQT